MALLEIKGLHAYYNNSHVLRGVGLKVEEGEIVSLLGRNGAGRSTLLKAIIGQVNVSGSIRYRGDEIAGEKTFEIARRGLAYVPEGRDIFPTLTVDQNLLLGQKRGVPSRWSLADMYRMFPLLKTRQHTRAGVLSGGEQQMLALCRSLMGDPDLIMIDEPTEGLAPQMVEMVAAYLDLLKTRGVSVLLVEQKLAIAIAISQRVYVMGHGSVVFEGSPAALDAASEVREEWLQV